MRLVFLVLCVLVAVGVFATMFISIWSARRGSAHVSSARENVAADWVWTAIPCLIIVAAASPAIISVAAPSSGEPQALSTNSRPAVPLEDGSATSARQLTIEVAKRGVTQKNHYGQQVHDR